MSANFYETGYIKLKQAHYAEAETELKCSLEAAYSSGNMECIGCAYRGLGDLYTEMGICDLSSEMYKKAIEAFALANDLFAVQEVKELLDRK